MLIIKKRYSIFTALDEISKFPQATDQSLATKLHQTLPSIYTDVYIPPKNGGVSFQIVHYAGQVNRITCLNFLKYLKIYL